MLGNKNKIEEAIKKEMGESTVVTHGLACPLTVVSSVDGKMGKRECVPPYFNNCHNCGCSPCGGHEKTAQNAAAISGSGGAPVAETMER